MWTGGTNTSPPSQPAFRGWYMNRTRRPVTRLRLTGRRLPGFLSTLLTACLLPMASGALPLLSASPAHADVTTVSTDTARTGWDSNEPGLAPSQVSSSDFGQQFSTAVDGQVYAQPLVAGKTVVAATENNKAYG